tara:strand:+ start:2747 stop:4048 length:1302 start_codon:yes stop_codon:yes gene_type:complete
MIYSKHKNLILFISFFLPFTYIIGIAITEFFVTLMILLFLIVNRNIQVYKNKLFIFFLLISFYFSINSIFQIYDNDLRISSIFHFRFALFSLSIFFLIEYSTSDTSKSKKILLGIFMILILLILDSFLQFLSGKNIFGFEIKNDRVSGIFDDELILGSFLLKVFPLTIWLIYFSNFEISKYKNLLIIFFSMYIITVYLSGERTSLFLIFLTTILFMFYLHNLRTILLKSFLIFLLFVMSTFITNFGKSDPFNRIFINTFNQITNNFYTKRDIQLDKKDLGDMTKDLKQNIQIFSTDHNGHYLLAYYLFKQAPIFGKGPEGFRYYCRKVEYNSKIGICSTHPHNIFMQLLSETGLIGIFFYLFGLIFVIFSLLKIYKKNIDLKNKYNFYIVSIAIIVNFFPLLPSGNFFNNWISIISYYYIGIYIYSYRKVMLK